MSVYLVTWDLNKEKPNYAQARQNFILHLERFENVKDSGLDSVRFINTDWSANDIDEDLRERLDNNDRLFVVKLTPSNYAGWLSKSTWDWIDSK